MVFARALDASVVFSFDKTGYRRHAKDFSPVDFSKRLSGKRIVITGANSGIGFSAASQFLRHGAEVIMVARHRGRADQAAQRLQTFAEQGGGSLRVEIADMSDLSDVRSLSNRLDGPIDTLIHNAGAMLSELTRTSDGFETITATHLIGPYLLTERLIDANKLEGSKDEPGRVVIVSSGGLYTQALDMRVLDNPPEPYDGMVHYAHTKRGQLLLSRHLDEKYRTRNVRCLCMHPGWVDTPGVERAMPKFYRWTGKILRNPDEGADTIVWLAAVEPTKLSNEEVFYFDRSVVPEHKLQSTRKGDAQSGALVRFLEDSAL
ncbi:MAG: SDR family NAD(P)-dependent oxidoreductase [Myxococcota bacterium]|nr:SDR family NAD(P)-dependent oxidoreductase [Myxococcota bacterium]